jgi:beta-galactosidase
LNKLPGAAHHEGLSMPKLPSLLLPFLLLQSCLLPPRREEEGLPPVPPPPLVAPTVDGRPGALDYAAGGGQEPQGGQGDGPLSRRGNPLLQRPGLGYSADAVYFDGQPLFLWSGELPYYRFSPELWGPRLDAARNAGVRFITSYVPWNLHEQVEGRFDFTGAGGDARMNLVGFIEQIARRGMYFIPKPGPFICAEVRHGGIPDWLTEGHPETAMRDERGRVVRFRQDRTVLPDPLNPTYLEYVRRWYTRLYRDVLQHYEHGRGPIVALQVDNELLYSTSSLANPFSWGYSPAVRAMYRGWLEDTYGDIARYNRLHAAQAADFGSIRPPRSADWRFRLPQQWLAFQDWVRFKEWYGASVLRSYASILRDLGVLVPLYHNAGMLEDQAPMAFGPLARELWLGVNFWLDPHPLASLSSYARGVRRLKQLRGSQPDRPSMASELNWGWGSAQEFDFLARYTMPFSKASNIYLLADSSQAGTLAGRPYSNSRQPYPGDAPLDSRGCPRPAYWRLQRLVGYTRAEGAGLAEAEPVASIWLGSYTPYNAPSLYLELARARPAELARVLRCPAGANRFLQDFLEGLIRRDAECRIVDLQAALGQALPAGGGLLIVFGKESMDSATQRRLARYVLEGGTLVLLPELPSLDLELEPATALKDALLPELEPGRGGGEAEELRFEGYPGVLRARSFSRIPGNLPEGYRVLGRDEHGEPAAVEKRAGRGRVVFLGDYLCDPDFFLWLAGQLGYEGRYAWSDDPQVEVVPLQNRRSGESYLFLINRGRSGRSPQVFYRDSLAPGEPMLLRTSLAAGSVSILAVRGGQLCSASLNGDGGVFLRGARFGLRLDPGAEADLLPAPGGDLLFRADRATRVKLELELSSTGDSLPAAGTSGPVMVLSGNGQRVAAGLEGGCLTFDYTPAAPGQQASSGRIEYYRIVGFPFLAQRQ